MDKKHKTITGPERQPITDFSKNASPECTCRDMPREAARPSDARAKNPAAAGLHIRPESETEFAEIHDLIRTAFETAHVSDGNEQDFADGLRSGEGYIPLLALVAELDGRPVGHSMLTKTAVERPDGSAFGALLLAPLSVRLEYRNRHIGSALIRESFRRAVQMGYTAVFLCGDPDYYGRFGFRRTSDFGIRPKHGLPEQYVLACELVPGALDGITGTVDYC